MRTTGNPADCVGCPLDIEAWNTVIGEPIPGVYVDISIPEWREGGKLVQGETVIGFAVKRPHWYGTKYFSILGNYENSYEAEAEAVRIALTLFPTLKVWCDHPDVVEVYGGHISVTDRVRYVPREQNRKAHYAARNKINFYNRRRDRGIPTEHEIQSHLQRLRLGDRAGSRR